MKKAVTGYISWWLFWILIQSIVLHRLGWSWDIALTDAAVSNLLLALAGFVTENTYKFYRPGSAQRLQRLGYAIALAVAYMYALRYVLMQIYSVNAAYLNFLELSIPLRFTIALLMIALMTVTSWLFFFTQEQEQNKARKEEAEKLVKEAELNNLRQQLQPHFLFNSLNSISALAGSRPEEARKMIQQLSDFLRGTLKKEEQQLVKLAEELQHLNLYLEIEKVRFGHRLKTEIDCDEKALEMLLPPLLLQPLVENAIKFGLYDTLDDTTIQLTAKAVNDNLQIEIKNPFDASTSKPKKGLGFGLNSVQRRLHLIYGRQDLLKVEQLQNTFISTLIIPQSK
jgi:two-component system, LytTR family, sensor kinase